MSQSCKEIEVEVLEIDGVVQSRQSDRDAASQVSGRDDARSSNAFWLSLQAIVIAGFKWLLFLFAALVAIAIACLVLMIAAGARMVRRMGRGSGG